MLTAFLKPFAGIAGALLLVLWLSATPYLWWHDRDPDAPPLIHAHFLWFRVAWPDNPSAKAKQAELDLGTCRTNTSALEIALKTQNAAVTALSERGRQVMTQEQNALQQAAGAAQKADQVRTVIMAPVQESDVCKRAKVVDQRFLESLR